MGESVVRSEGPGEHHREPANERSENETEIDQVTLEVQQYSCHDVTVVKYASDLTFLTSGRFDDTQVYAHHKSTERGFTERGFTLMKYEIHRFGV